MTASGLPAGPPARPSASTLASTQASPQPGTQAIAPTRRPSARSTEPLDRVVAEPLELGGGWPPRAAVRSLWVVRLSALGDVVLCEPAISALAGRYPEARLTVVTRARWHPVFAGCAAVADCLTPEAARLAPAPDLAVDLHNRFDTRRLAARARWRVTWVKRRASDWWRAVRGQPLHRAYAEGPHQVARIARALALPEADRPPRLAPPPHSAATEAPPPAALAAAGAILLAPGASRAVKAWPAARFVALARALVAQGEPVAVVGGPDEAELLVEVAEAAGVPCLSPQLDVAQLMGALAAARALVGNDSGPAHLAAALGTPVVVLFGPTPPGRWGPGAGQGEAVTLHPRCGPCSDHGARACRAPRRWCLDDLPPAAVLAALARLERRMRAVAAADHEPALDNPPRPDWQVPR